MSEEFKVELGVELDESSLQATEQRLKDIGKNTKAKVQVDVDDNGSTAKASNGIKQVEQSARSASSSTKSFGDTLKRSLNIGSAAAITARGIRMIENSARDAVQAVKDIDGAITDLRMATGESYKNVQNLVKGYNQMGQALGATTTEVTDSADAWLRQGNSVKETNTLIKDSMILSKVGQIDSADATKYLTSAMKGYGVAAEDVLGIVDKLTAVDLVSATDAGGLAEAMSRTAETANLAGVSMDKLLGYLAVTGETTQKSMSSIGESFKTIFTRMADIKADKLELIDEDGTTETLSQVETVLNNLGIKLRDSDNEFRNFGDVLDEVAAGWSNYSSVQQAAISKAFAGTRQSENFKVLMENYDKARQYMETAMDSSGTAEQKFSAYLDSIEAKSKSLQAAFESLSVNTFSTDLVGGIIEASTALVQFLDKTNLLKGTLAGLAAAGAIKGFSVMATGIANAAKTLNEFNAALKLVKMGDIGTSEIQQLVTMTENLSQSQLKAVLSAKTLSTQQRVAILMGQGMSQAEAQAALATMGLATAEGTATTATFSLSGAFKGLFSTLMANPLILIVAGVTAAVSAFSTYKQKLEETKRATIEAGQAAVQSGNDIYTSVTKYLELSEAMENGTGSADAFADAQDAVLSALGLTGEGIDTLITKYGDLKTAILDVAKEQLDTALSTALAGVKAGQKDAIDELVTFFGDNSMVSAGGKDSVDAFAALAKQGYISSGSYGSGGGSIVLPHSATWDAFSSPSFEDMMENYKYLEEVMNYLSKDYADTDLFSKVADMYNTYGDALKSVVEDIDAANNLIANGLIIDAKAKNSVDDLESYIEMRNELISQLENDKNFNTNGSESASGIIDTLLSQSNAFREYSIQYQNYLEGIQDTTDKAEDVFDNLKKTFKDNSISQWFDGLSDEDKEFVYQISVRSDDTTLWTLDRWKQELQTLQDTGSTTSEQMTVLDKALNGVGDETGLSEKINNYTSELSKLEDVLTKIDTGTLTENDKISLALEYPELAGTINDTDALKNAIHVDCQAELTHFYVES